MLTDKEEDNLFFDSVDYFSFQGSIVTEEELNSAKIEYEIWLREPQSVKERRQSFLHGIGLDFAGRRNKSPEFDRITECSGAVSSSSVSSASSEERNVVCCGREGNSEANCMVDEMSHDKFGETYMVGQHKDFGSSLPVQACELSETEDSENLKVGKNKMKSWWKYLSRKRKEIGDMCVLKPSKLNPEAPKTQRVKVKQNKKSCVEFTGIFKGQEIQAHKGLIWTMKFSPDGQFLATGGEDGVVLIWHVTSVDAYLNSLAEEVGVSIELKKSKLTTKKLNHASVVIPDKVFQIEESPVQEFHGHASDVLDLAWSNSNYLLSSSTDKTVRLWKVGCDHCLNVFHHSNYVTCIQFNPVDQNYFISGSIDGKVRIWGLTEKRVVNWVDVRDVISAICYQPDAKGFVVGCFTGSCRFYEVSGNELQLEAELNFRSGKKTSGNRITSIQFVDERSQKVMITSEDSKVRIFDGVDIVAKYKGLPKSGSQMSASFTSAGRHIISVGEDCRVYVWNYDDLCIPSSKHIKSVRSCEYFFAECVSVAVPWLGVGRESKTTRSGRLHSCLQREDCASWRRDSDRFSLGNWFFMDGPRRGSSATWPEEKLLPLWEVPDIENDYHHYQPPRSLADQQADNDDAPDYSVPSEAWGLVIVTAGMDGKIRTFHNYGLPIRL
ncbi:hypothetical protein K2173_011964 [Erythroxylum novogranatense]|uniref:Uncharacterized protein n=1 Tax=Erythroxylum novogranatense TaxID=1862640 RepID=A0AAV8TEH7_9ROSI|nr:hypothetical protein K2173_011964 [Erythroxylum novogranatense]